MGAFGFLNGPSGKSGSNPQQYYQNQANSFAPNWSNGEPTQSSYNPNPGAYGGGLQDTFNVDPSSGGNVSRVGMWGSQYNGPSASSNDPDVQAAQNIANEEASARLGINHGVNFNADDALLQMYEGRIGAKNSIANQIANNGTLKMGAIQSDQAAANNALGQGINNTDSNYNSRGLLFSGARQAGEQQVRGQVGSALANSLAGTQQDYAQQLAASQNAYANVDLQGASQALTMAQNAAATASQNSIARLQAFQQLGGGVGSAAGTIAGSLSGGSSLQTSSMPTTAMINDSAGWDATGSGGINNPFNNGSSQFGGYLQDYMQPQYGVA